MKKKKRERMVESSATLEGLAPHVQKIVREHAEREKCKAKRKYLTASAAEMMADYYANEARRVKKSAQYSRPYHCPWCGFFHLTTNPARGGGR